MDSEFEALPWDSEFFDLVMGRITARSLSAAGLDALLARAAEAGCALAELFCDAADDASIAAAQDRGFLLADLKLDFVLDLDAVRPLVAAEGAARFREAGPADEADLLALASGIFPGGRHSRYPGFDPRRAEAMYQLWLSKSLRGQLDDLCLAVLADDEPAGFCTVKFSGDRARLGLLGVGRAFRGRGLGRALLAHVLDRLRRDGVTRAHVATQGRNRPAVRLYGRAGFVLDSLTLCYYRRLA